jgi:LppX/LprAFG-like lipoprotein
MRKAGIALSAFALAVTLGACAGNADSGNAKNTGTRETGATEAVSLVDLAKSIGDKTSDANSAHMKITAQAAGEDISGEGDLKFGSADAAMTMEVTTPEGAISMVFVDGVLYVKLPQELEPGKPWLKIDPASDNATAKSLGELNDQLGKNADPRAVLKEFEKSGEITSTKKETLNGKETTHYTVTVDVQKMADNQTDPTQKKAMQEVVAAGVTSFPVEVWVDGDDLPVRFALETPVPDGQGGRTAVKVQVDYSDWGKAVTVDAPPAAQTAELPNK